MEALSQYTIDRWLNVEVTKGVVPTLQMFCDSSKVAYSFVFYRMVQADKMLVIRFLFAKSRQRMLKKPDTTKVSHASS